ncbi:MAG: exo-alpha-sialidase [Coriobacteriaceae bacterium]|nr:exo-alpha-sialidase [Coriobacteriaceae bacterium]
MGKARWRKLAAAATGVVLALAMLPVGALAQGSGETSGGLPTATEYQRQTADRLESGGTYTVVSTTTTDQSLRIMHLSNGTTKLDQCRVTSGTVADPGDKLEPTDCAVAAYAGTRAHDWTITAVEGGYTVQTQTAGGTYLNINAGGVGAGSEAQVLDIRKTGANTYAISRTVDGTTYYLSHAGASWTFSATAYNVYVYRKAEVAAEVVPNGNSRTGTTEGQPFAPGTGGSANFRIPSIITLGDGSLLAAVDARWNHQGDAGALDTIISKSTNNGQTWNYSFVNYFNDSTDAYNNRATAFIDPVMVEKDGTVYMMTDIWPGGVALNSSFNNHPVSSSGYVTIDGKWRMALYSSPNPDVQRAAGAERGTGYTHYVGDFAQDGYAPVIDAADGATDYYVDDHYYLYDANKTPVWCQQLGSSKYVQQNVFYWNADLHVTATSWLWLIRSDNGGATWSAPQMLNEQVRTGLPQNSSFYGVGPGRGLVTSSGRIILPCYVFQYGRGDGPTSVIYSDDGVTWHRSEDLDLQASEATVVEADGLLYIFARHGVCAVSRDNGETWVDEQSIRGTGINIHEYCQIDAITYSRSIDGKTAILLSCPTGSGRANGTIFVGLVQGDGSIDWAYSHAVTSNGAPYAYSCLTEQRDGSIGLLYEGNGVTYKNIAIEDIAAGAAIGNNRTLSVPLYGTYTQTVSGGFAGYEGVDPSIVGIAVTDNGNGTSTVTYTGKSEGTVEFAETSSGIEYTVTVEPSQLAEVAVEAGESTDVILSGTTVGHEADPAIATTRVASKPYSEILGETPGSLGSDATYTGGVVKLSDARYTFVKSGDNWVISNTTGGRTVYLNLTGSSGQRPNGTNPSTFELRQGTTGGTFKLYDTGRPAYLYFYRDGRNIFDRNSTDCGAPLDFEIWRLDDSARSAATPGCAQAADGPEAAGGGALDNGASDDAIPGYAQVADASEITDGGAFLIVANVDGTRYALYPSASTATGAPHVVKVDPARAGQTLTVTGVAPGTTDVMVGGVVYRITVAGYLPPTFAWADDYSSATATFARSAGGEDKVLDAVVTSETVAATCTTDGKVTYTATVQFDGATHTDVRTVTLPATGHRNVTHVAARAATATEPGNLEYWICSDCGTLYSDAALTTVTTLEAVTIPATGEPGPEPGPEPEAKTFSVTFADGLADTRDTVVEVRYGATVAKPADPTRDGWAFAGWFADPGLTIAYDFSSPVTSDLTLYGGWARADAPDAPVKKPAPPADAPDAAVKKPAPPAATPATGDPASAAALVAMLGGGASALGVGLRRRKR